MKKLLLLIIANILLVSAIASATVVFEDNFNDGNYNQSPVWDLGLGGNIYVTSGQLNHDGMIVDQSGRYWSVLNSNVSFIADNELTFSYKGLLKSEGNPQEGRGILLVLYGTNGDRYDLRIQDGFTSGFPTNQHSLSLGYGTGGNIYDYIVTNFTPEKDRFYDIKAERENDTWYLFVDGVLIGSHEDTLKIKNFNLVQMPMVGSIRVDDIKVELPTSEVPEFGTFGLILLPLILCLLLARKRK